MNARDCSTPGARHQTPAELPRRAAPAMPEA